MTLMQNIYYQISLDRKLADMVKLKNIVNGTFLENEPMKKHTSYGIGGPAKAFIIPKDKEEISKILLFCNKNQIPTYFIGSGSNLLVSDKGFKGVIITPNKVLKKLFFNQNNVIAESGVMLGKLVKECMKKNLTGLESLVGVPGTLGGALVMNAGAFGHEISNYILSVDVMKMNGDIHTLNNSEIDFSYRFSTFKKDEFILQAAFEFPIGYSKEIQKNRIKASKGRKSSQPLRFRSAGSVFKNPLEHPAGYLIDKAGLKGTKVGDAEISNHHANFFINHGNAKANDIIELIRLARLEVFKKFGIKLDLEIKTIGFNKTDLNHYEA